MKDFNVVNPRKLLMKQIKNSHYYLPQGCRGGICIDAGCNMGDFELRHKDRFDLYVCIDVLEQNLVWCEYNLKQADIPRCILKRACHNRDGETVEVYAHRTPKGEYNYFGNGAHVGTCLYEDLNSKSGWHKEDVIDRVPSISIEKLIEDYGEIKCLKFDIEGAEHNFLYGKDLSKIEYLTGELHFDYKNPNGEFVKHIKQTHNIVKRRNHLYTFIRK